jgi:hypothetical protein
MKRLVLCFATLVLGGAAAAQQAHDHAHDHGMSAFSRDAREAFTATPAFAADGTLWVARGLADRVVVSRSRDLGKSFEPDVSVSPQPLNMDWGPDSRPQIAIGKDGSLLVSYAIFQDKKFNGRVFTTRSTDGGHSFAAAVPITPDSTSQRFQATAVAPDGRVFAAWLDKRNAAPAIASGKPYPGAALAYAWADRGGAFGSTGLAFDNTCECCRLAVAFTPAGTPAVMFRNVFPGSVRDHAVVTFGTDGKPGPMRRVSVDDWKIDACPHHGPSLSISPNGSYHAAWFTNGSAREGLFYARADDATAPFGAPRALSSVDRQPARPFVLATAAAVHLVWKEFDGEKTTVMWQVSTDDGRSWTKPSVAAETADASDHPLLIARGSQVYLSWLTKIEGYRLIALGGST